MGDGGAAGLDAHASDARRESPRSRSLCEQVVLGATAIMVPDTARDARLDDRPVIPGAGVRFYAGVPLRSGAGPVIGALCLMDTEPRTMDDSEMLLLASMAEQVMALVQAGPTPGRPATPTVPETDPGPLPAAASA